jgi:hypothetical protein
MPRQHARGVRQDHPSCASADDWGPTTPRKKEKPQISLQPSFPDLAETYSLLDLVIALSRLMLRLIRFC